MKTFEENIIARLQLLEREVERLRVGDKADSAAFGRPVFLATPKTSDSWDGDARSTTAKTKIDLSEVFGVPAGVKAVEVYWAWQDSGSAGTNCWLCLSPNNTNASGIFLGAYGQANDKRLFGSAKIPCDPNGDIYYEISASGTGTMDVWLLIWGYWL